MQAYCDPPLQAINVQSATLTTWLTLTQPITPYFLPRLFANPRNVSQHADPYTLYQFLFDWGKQGNNEKVWMEMKVLIKDSYNNKHKSWTTLFPSCIHYGDWYVLENVHGRWNVWKRGSFEWCGERTPLWRHYEGENHERIMNSLCFIERLGHLRVAHITSWIRGVSNNSGRLYQIMRNTWNEVAVDLPHMC